MSSELNQLRLEQVQSTLSEYTDWVKRQRPSRGWLKLIREALGRTERQQAQRLGISGATLHKSEQSEAEDRISLGQLRKLADGLDCELVYALVPRRPLTDVVQERARAIAMEEVGNVAHTMGLEDQRPGSDRLRKQVERRTEELLRGRRPDTPGPQREVWAHPGTLGHPRRPERLGAGKHLARRALAQTGQNTASAQRRVLPRVAQADVREDLGVGRHLSPVGQEHRL